MAGALFGATLAAWVLLLLASAFARGPRPTPGPATLSPGPEAPAIVDLLVHTWKPTRAIAALAAALSHYLHGAMGDEQVNAELRTENWKRARGAPVATLLDLAARGHLRLVAEPSGRLVCQIPSLIPSEPLALFEQQLHQLVAGRLCGDSTPAGALLPGPDDEDGKRWYATFKSAVIDEARRLGLVRDRFLLSRRVRWGLRAAAALPAAALGWKLFSLSNGSQPLLFAYSLVAWGLFFLASTVPGGLRGTGPGCEAVSRWLGVRAALLTASRPSQLPEAGGSLDDRMLAWAVALDAAPDVLNALAPADSGRVWSSTGGRWRQVGVSKRGLASGWTRRHSETVSQRRTFTGRVIRRWTMPVFGDYAIEGSYGRARAIGKKNYYLAVDDGRSEWALAWCVRKRHYKRFTLESAVLVTVDDEGRLFEITEAKGHAWLTRGRPSMSDGSAANVDHQARRALERHDTDTDRTAHTKAPRDVPVEIPEWACLLQHIQVRHQIRQLVRRQTVGSVGHAVMDDDEHARRALQRRRLDARRRGWKASAVLRGHLEGRDRAAAGVLDDEAVEAILVTDPYRRDQSQRPGRSGPAPRLAGAAKVSGSCRLSLGGDSIVIAWSHRSRAGVVPSCARRFWSRRAVCGCVRRGLARMGTAGSCEQQNGQRDRESHVGSPLACDPLRPTHGTMEIANRYVAAHGTVGPARFVNAHTASRELQ